MNQVVPPATILSRRRLGPPAAYRWRDHTYCRCWDLLHGVATCGEIHPRDLNMPGDLRRYSAGYMPTHPRHARLLFQSLPLSAGRYTLVDFGSGKGRVLVTAMGFPFRSVVGVEISPELDGIAQRNLRRYRGKRACRDVRSLCMDVREYAIEPTPSVYYFFSPFTEPVMRPVLENIFRSLGQHPRDCFIMYVNAELDRLIEGSGLFQVFGASQYSTVWRFTGKT